MKFTYLAMAVETYLEGKIVERFCQLVNYLEVHRV